MLSWHKVSEKKVAGLCAVVGGKQRAPWVKIEIMVCDARPACKVMLFCVNYKNYLADVSW